MPLELARSILFATFGSYTLFISLSFLDLSRTIFTYSLTENRFLLAGIAIGMLILISTFTVPALQSAFSVQPLPPVWLVFIAFWIVLNILIVEAAKWFANTFIVKIMDRRADLA